MSRPTEQSRFGALDDDELAARKRHLESELPPLDAEEDLEHCATCGKPHVSHERTPADRVCPECRFAHLELDDAAPAGQGETPQ